MNGVKRRKMAAFIREVRVPADKRSSGDAMLRRLARRLAQIGETVEAIRASVETNLEGNFHVS